ncbi:MAG: response regulator [Candidatus Magnetominusculus sp. LBB02]|nr:response regulator [Candidatus Magnetominusculus sp. LBB02]
MENDKILILDDEQIVIDAITRHLSRKKYEIYSGKDGKEGLALYDKVNPILIILDLRMPVMDGVEFLRRIKLKPADPCSVVVLTGHGSDEDMERCFELGVSAFLRKPFNIYELLGIVTHSIALKKVELDLKAELTQRAKMEDELRRYRHHLEELVETRTAELQKEVVERTNAEMLAMRSLKDKEVLLREIHHRVKNNLQIVSSLLDLQVKNIKDPQTKLMFKDSQNRLKTMAILHEKLYQSDNMAEIDFAKYINNLLGHLYRSYCMDTSRILISTDIEEATIGLDTAVPCGLIINELVSNSLKHAFNDGRSGSLTVSMKKLDDGRFKLTVRDTGVGLPDGMDFKKSKSLGLRLVNALVVEQLEGTLEFNSNDGASFSVTFTELKHSSRGAKDGK